MTALQAGVAEVAAALAGAAVGTILPPMAIDAAIDEGVAPLLAASPAAATLDASSRARLLDHVRASAIHDAALDDELRRLLPALAADGYTPIVIKGAHLAHALYPAPHLRPRDDTDFLIAPAARAGFARALAARGYGPARLTSGSLILGQFLYQKELGPGLVHYTDVHWRAAAPLVFGDAFDAQAIAADSVPIPALGPAARGPAPHDALALACVHVVSHHWPGASLRWLYDLRLLAGALDEGSREAFARAAARGRYRAVAACALARARDVFPSDALDLAIDAVNAAGAFDSPRSRIPGGDEPSAALTKPGRTAFVDFLLDLRVAGWRRGATLVREHLFPPAEYMRMAFGDRPLAIAYLARFLRAARRRV
jgi:hypothetical protein